jgi:hypothetical protein
VMTRRTVFGSFISVVMIAGPMVHGQKRDEIRDRQGKLIGTIVHRRDGVRGARDRLTRDAKPLARDFEVPQGIVLIAPACRRRRGGRQIPADPCYGAKWPSLSTCTGLLSIDLRRGLTRLGRCGSLRKAQRTCQELGVC